MKAKVLIKGETLEDQITCVDKVLTRLMRRSGKSVYAVTSPIPICAYTEVVTGSILRFMFPVDGVVSKVVFNVDSMPKGGVEVTITMESSKLKTVKEFTTKRSFDSFEQDLEVVAGTRLNIEVKPVKEEEEVSGVWVSFLWLPEKDLITVKDYLIEKLEEEIENAKKDGETTEEAGSEEGSEGRE